MTKPKKTATKKAGSRKGAKTATTTAGARRAAQDGKKAKGSATKATSKQRAATAKQGAKTAKPKGAAREGSKKAQVLEMMRRPEGAGLKEIMGTMGWQAHTVRGFMAGTLKKMDLRVESFKREDGERAYRLQ